jgi:uncharacterized repeat protein (TIGR02543 family)
MGAAYYMTALVFSNGSAVIDRMAMPRALFLVSFDTGDGGLPVPDVQRVFPNSLASSPDIPAIIGSDFLGWYKEADCVNPWNFDRDTVTRDITLYAKWAQTAYIVTFDTEGGSPIPPQEVPHGGTAMRPTPSQEPAKTGHTFDGWYTTSGGTTPFDFDTAITADTTIYAGWVPISK